MSFDSEDGYQTYMADQERQAHRTLLDGIEVAQRLLRVHDVEVC